MLFISDFNKPRIKNRNFNYVYAYLDNYIQNVAPIKIKIKRYM